jgi:hypothetical protein
MRSRCSHWLVAMLTVASPAAAQEGGSPAALVRGEILDAESGQGLAGAVVRLVADSPVAASREQATITGPGGAYRFEAVLPGRHVITVERIGYRGARLQVVVRRPGEARVSVGLELSPIALEPVAVRGSAAAPYDRGLSGVAGGIPAVRLRQQRYLGTDVRSLTHRELEESVTLGEADLFRALHRLASVSTRDDWSAELWTRNAAWDQTRVTLDGLPLYSPLHGAGVFGGVNPDAMGAVYLHPGVRPARLGAGGAGFLELRTRPASARELGGFGELSLASARLAVDRRTGGGGWLLAARRTYLDWLTRGLEGLFDIEDAAIPYHYTDVTARVDGTLPDGSAIEASGTWMLDEVTGDVPDVLHGSEASWGNRAARITLAREIAGLRTRHTLGVTAYRANLDTVPPDTGLGLSAERVRPLDHNLTHIVFRGELGPRDDGSGTRNERSGTALNPTEAWDGGYEVVREIVSAVGAPPSPFLEVPVTALDSLDVRQALTRLQAWYERRWSPGPIDLLTGLRVEIGTGIADSGPVRLAPRAQLRWALSDRLTLGVGVGRSYQYAQSPVPVGLPLGVSRSPIFPAGAFWVLAGDSVPALRSDVATVGGEVWLDARHLLSVTAYTRAADGVLVPDPRSGLSVDRPLYVVAEERARGIEATVRRLEGRLTGSLSYALAGATQETLGLRYAPAADRRHSVDLTARFAVTPALAAGAAFTYATGSPYTRVVIVPSDAPDPTATAVRGSPNARRTSAYASLDLSLDWMKSFRTWGIGVFVQVRNALNRSNQASYSDSHLSCGENDAMRITPGGVVCDPGGRAPTLRDEFVQAMPRTPLLGLRLRF